MRRLFIPFVAAVSLAGASGSALAGDTLNSALGGGLGGAIGAAVGGSMGGQTGAVIGGGLGGAGGAVIADKLNERDDYRYRDDRYRRDWRRDRGHDHWGRWHR